MSARISLLVLLLLVTVISASTRWLGQDFRVPAEPTPVARPLEASQSALAICELPCPLSYPDDGPLPKPYASSRELRADLENRNHWVKHLLVMPVRRAGKPFGLRLKFRTSQHPFGRLGFRNGDILLSMNGHSINEVAACPVVGDALMDPPLRFQLERAGRVCSVVVDP
ncbi:hypothetical protein JST97_09235 [bacterium]|nr:hypothetical protein [bacterium]